MHKLANGNSPDHQKYGAPPSTSRQRPRHRDHRPRVARAISLQRFFQRLAPQRIAGRIGSFEPCRLRITAILHFEDAVIKLGSDSREHSLDRPAAALITVIPVVPSDRQKIDRRLGHRFEARGEVMPVWLVAVVMTWGFALLGVWVLPTYALACHLGRRLGMRRLT